MRKCKGGAGVWFVEVLLNAVSKISNILLQERTLKPYFFTAEFNFTHFIFANHSFVISICFGKIDLPNKDWFKKNSDILFKKWVFDVEL